MTMKADGSDGTATPTALSPDEFMRAALHIIGNLTGDPMHRAFDQLSNDQLKALGYGAGVNVFEAAVRRQHQ